MKQDWHDLMSTLASQNWFSYQKKTGQEDQHRKLTNNLHNAMVEVRAFLAQTSISVNELLNLQFDYGNPFEERHRKPFDFFKLKTELTFKRKES